MEKFPDAERRGHDRGDGVLVLQRRAGTGYAEVLEDEAGFEGFDSFLAD